MMNRIDTTRRPRFRASCLLVALAVLFSFTACSNNNNNNNNSDNENFRFFVSNNGGTNAGSIDEYVNLVRTGTLNSGNNQGLYFDIANNLYHAGDFGVQQQAPALTGTDGGIASGGGVLIFSAYPDRSTGDLFDPSLDRELGGASSSQTGLVLPKGIAVADRDGFLFVADFGDGNVKVFGTAAGGDAPPFATTPIGGNPWDIAYDRFSDRLFVAVTNGQVEVFDNYVAGGFGQAGATRTIIPSDGTVQTSTNLHGIVYDSTLDCLFVSDVGAANAGQSPNFASDGAIYCIDAAETANGLTVPGLVISGPATLLGNPVDLLLSRQGDLYVAEKANGMILLFNDLITRPSGDIAPNNMVMAVGPEALAVFSVNHADDPDVSDVDNSVTSIDGIGMTSNPGTVGPNTGAFLRVNSSLNTQLGLFDTMLSLENVVFDHTGDGFFTFDDGSNTNGGIFILNRANAARGPVTPSRDRSITGGNTGLVSPKGIEVSRDLGQIFVAENNATTPSIIAFGTQAMGDVSPLFVTDLTGVGRPWDLDYDPMNDRLFVALTNGVVAVFDRYSIDRGVGGPNRMITPTDGVAQVSVNLHGIVYDARTDMLILADVGSAADATDGQLFLIPNAALASGMTTAPTIIAGPNSLLGNPVDIAYDGANLYVAEKANGMLLRFDNFLGAVSGDLPPSQSSVQDSPESVSIIPTFLSKIPTN